MQCPSKIKSSVPFFVTITMDTAQSFILKLAETELEKELFHLIKVLSNGTKLSELKNHCFNFLPAFAKALQQIETHLTSRSVLPRQW